MKLILASAVATLALLTVAFAPFARAETPSLASDHSAPAASAISHLPLESSDGSSHTFAFLGVSLIALAFLGVVTENARRTIDANLLITHVLPAAGATVHANSINLNSLSAGRIPLVEFDVQCPATPALADTKNIVFTIEDSADNATFAAVADLPTIDILGAGGVGAAAFDRRFKLPIGIRQYVRVSATADAAAGDSTALSYQFSLVF